jgi:hypothetical protein
MGEAKRKKALRAGAAAGAAGPASEFPEDWNAALAPPIVPGKSCGSCTKCCKVMSISELKKPAFTECVHVAAGLGCKIYSERPRSCRQFICGWLLDPGMGPDLKPENCHVVFYQQHEQNIVATCDADYPDAWRAPTVMAFLKHLASGLHVGRKIIVMEKGHIWYMTRDGIVSADRG